MEGFFTAPATDDPRPIFLRLEQQALASFARVFDDQVDWIDAHLADVKQQQAVRVRAESTAQVARLIQTPSRQKVAHAQRSPDKPPIAPLRFNEAVNRSPVSKTQARAPAPEPVYSPLAGSSRSVARDVFGSPIQPLSGIGRMRSPPPRTASPPAKTLMSPAQILSRAELPKPAPSSSPLKGSTVPAAREGGMVTSPRLADVVGAASDGNLSIISEGTEPDDNGPNRGSRLLSNTILAALASPPPSQGATNHIPALTSPLKQSTSAAPRSSPRQEAPTPPPKDIEMVSADRGAKGSAASRVQTVSSAKSAMSPIAQPARASTPVRTTTPSHLPRAASPTQDVPRPWSPKSASLRPLSPRPASPAPSLLRQATSPARIGGQSVEVPLKESSAASNFNRSLHRTPASSHFAMPPKEAPTTGKRLSGGLPLPPSPTSTFLTHQASRPSTFQFGALLNRERDAARPSSAPKAGRTSFLASLAAAGASSEPPAATVNRLPLKRKSSAEPVEQLPAKVARPASPPPPPAAKVDKPTVETLKSRLEMMSKSTAARPSVQPQPAAVPAPPAEPVTAMVEPVAAAIEPVAATVEPLKREQPASPPRPPRSPARPITSPPKTVVPVEKHLSPPKLDQVRTSITLADTIGIAEVLPPIQSNAAPEPSVASSRAASPEKDAEYEMVPVSDAPTMPGSFAEDEMDIDDVPAAQSTPKAAAPVVNATTTPPFSPPTNIVVLAQLQSLIASTVLPGTPPALPPPPPQEDDEGDDADAEGDTVPDIDDAMTMTEVDDDEEGHMADIENKTRNTTFFGDDLTQDTQAFPRPPAIAEPSPLKKTTSTTELPTIAASTSLASSAAANASNLLSSVFSKIPGATAAPKSKPEIQSLQQAKAARAKEAAEAERKQKEEERRRQLEEKRKQQRETMGEGEKKRKERDGMAASTSALPTKAKSLTRPKTLGGEEEPAKKRKIEAEAVKKPGELRKPHESAGPLSRPPSALGQSSTSQLRTGAPKAAGPSAATAPMSAKPKLTTSISATGSALIGQKFMQEPSAVRPPAPAAAVKPAAPPAKPVASTSKPATAKPVAGPSRASTKSTLAQSRVSAKILQQAAAVLEEEVELPDIDSEYSDPEDHAGHAKRDAERVEWAQSPQMRAALKMQESYNPDQLFGRVESVVDLETIFTGGNGSRVSRMRPRSSSAVWLHDRLTEEEKEAYNQKRYGHV